jgi:hypothetical protein
MALVAAVPCRCLPPVTGSRRFHGGAVNSTTQVLVGGYWMCYKEKHPPNLSLIDRWRLHRCRVPGPVLTDSSFGPRSADRGPPVGSINVMDVYSPVQ